MWWHCTKSCKNSKIVLASKGLRFTCINDSIFISIWKTCKSNKSIAIEIEMHKSHRIFNYIFSFVYNFNQILNHILYFRVKLILLIFIFPKLKISSRCLTEILEVCIFYFLCLLFFYFIETLTFSWNIKYIS